MVLGSIHLRRVFPEVLYLCPEAFHQTSNPIKYLGPEGVLYLVDTPKDPLYHDVVSSLVTPN